MSDEPLFSCSDEYCRTECSFPAGDLRVGPDGPFCEYCWEEAAWDWQESNKPEWNELPPFVPAHVKRIKELEAELAALKRGIEIGEGQ